MRKRALPSNDKVSSDYCNAKEKPRISSYVITPAHHTLSIFETILNVFIQIAAKLLHALPNRRRIAAESLPYFANLSSVHHVVKPLVSPQ